MSDAFLRVLNAPTGDDIAVARMWEQYDIDASEWDADSDSETDSDVTVEYDWEADHDDNEDGNMLSNDIECAIARAEALPEYVLEEQDDITIATTSL